MSAADTARSYFEAVAARDIERMVSHYSDEIVVDFLGQGIFRGPDEMRELFTAIFRAVPDAEMLTERIVGGDGVAVVEWRLRGNFNGDGEVFGIEPTGRWIEQRGCDVIEIDDDGKISHNIAYQDGMEMARAMGLMPPADSGPERAMKQAFNLATKARRVLADRLSG